MTGAGGAGAGGSAGGASETDGPEADEIVADGSVAAGSEADGPESDESEAADEIVADESEADGSEAGVPGVPSSPRVQHHGRVVAVLDGDAHLHVWEPNADDDRLDVGLDEHVAVLVHLGLGAPPAPEPHWAERGGRTVIVSFDPGVEGRVTVDGHHVSEAAATRLAAAGFLRLLREALDRPLGEPDGEPAVEAPADVAPAGEAEPSGEQPGPSATGSGHDVEPEADR